MKRHLQRSALALAITAGLALPQAAYAHRTWLLPSATVVSGSDSWVTVDAAVSNDIFYFDHFPLRLDSLVVTGPDGAPVATENASTGRYRSTFDVKLAKPGTYRIAIVNDMLTASYKLGGETKRARGTAESLGREIPADAKDVQVSHNVSRVETFVTAGKPTAIVPTNKGIELIPVTHPNDLVAGSTGTLRFLDDGKPAQGLLVSVIPSGIRYRDQLDETKLSTDANGEVKIRWGGPGMYWIGASPARSGGGEGAGAPREPAGTLAKPTRRAGYSGTIEVLSP